MKDKLERVGTLAELKTEWGMVVFVEIIDYKNSYGRDRWLVKPVSGRGEAWVEKIT
jgi:hypothetical protein